MNDTDQENKTATWTDPIVSSCLQDFELRLTAKEIHYLYTHYEVQYYSESYRFYTGNLCSVFPNVWLTNARRVIQ